MFSQEQLIAAAPIALYPDSLLAQIFMASTYPLEIVQAKRWLDQNKQLQDDSLTAALEKQPWDPSVKSLINFPQVLTMMNEQLDWTTKLGDAFLAQQKDVMDTVQRLRVKAQDAGNLKTTQEQKVIVEQQVIRTNRPVRRYSCADLQPDGVWVLGYPSHPPYSYYPPGYVPGAALFSFGVGVAMGAAWGYAWGGCNWRGGDVDIDIDRNTNINRNINRESYRGNYQRSGQGGAGGRGSWQHNAEHRKGVAYRDQRTAQQQQRHRQRHGQSAKTIAAGPRRAPDLGRGGPDWRRQPRASGRGARKPAGARPVSAAVRASGRGPGGRAGARPRRQP
jgi:hypothetical protein